jgi:hypothetical protein
VIGVEFDIQMCGGTLSTSQTAKTVTHENRSIAAGFTDSVVAEGGLP